MSLIQPTDDFSILALLIFAAAIGIVGEHKKWYGNFPGVLITIILAAIFTSINLLPSGSDQNINVPVYDFAFSFLIPYSIPLLLFNVEFRRIFKESGRLLLIFLLGSLTVSLGAILAGQIIDLGDETYKIAGVYTATYTGGSVNFMAVADVFKFLESPLFAASILVDNVFTILFIMLLFLLPKINFLNKYYPRADREIPIFSEQESNRNEFLIVDLSMALAISAVLVAIGKLLAPGIEALIGTDLKLDVLVITILVIIVANLFPKYLGKLEKVAFQVGMLLLYVFLAVIGATCDILSLLSASPKVLFFAVITVFFHLITILLIGKALKFSLEEIAIASGANVGGVSISAPMAGAFDMKKAVTPAILIGIMGYVVGTFLGVGVGLLLK